MNTKNEDLLAEVNKKLLPLARKQQMESKYFKQKDEKENCILNLENRIKRKISQEKRMNFNIEEKTIDKIQKMLSCLIKLNPETIGKIDSQFATKIDSQIQTEEDETGILIEKVAMLEKENQININKKSKYKKELQLLQKENTELKSANDKLIKENSLLQSSIEDLTKIKSDNEKIIQNLKVEVANLQNNILEYQKNINDLNQMKKLFNEKVQIDIQRDEVHLKLKNNLLEFTKNKAPIFILISTRLLSKVVSYLDIKDICNLKLVNKEISIEISNSSTILRNFYHKILTLKNQKISSIEKYDIKKEYLVKNIQLEQLIGEYALSKKYPGKDLKVIIGKCLNFLNKNVKVPLGYPPSRVKNSFNEGSGYSTPGGVNQSSGYGYFLGGIKNMFGFSQQNQAMNVNMNMNTNMNIQNKTETNSNIQSPNKIRSQAGSRGMSFSTLSVADAKTNIDNYDSILISELNSKDNGIVSIYEFDFQASDDIKMYLNKFLKTNFPVDKLTAFIQELITGYSELLYASNKSLSEVREMEIVKNALNERFKYFYKLTKDYEGKIQLQSSMLMTSKTMPINNNISKIYTVNSEDNSNMNIREEEEEEEKGKEKESEIIKQEKEKIAEELESNKMNLEIYQTKAKLYQEKFEEIKIEYEQFKNIFSKENNSLKYELELISKERDNLLKQIEDFNKFFEHIHFE